MNNLCLAAVPDVGVPNALFNVIERGRFSWVRHSFSFAFSPTQTAFPSTSSLIMFINLNTITLQMRASAFDLRRVQVDDRDGAAIQKLIENTENIYDWISG
jgi:hypothetical protein